MNEKNQGMRKCSICKKIFLPSPMHMYRTEKGIQCSYTCYRKAGGDNAKYTQHRAHPKRYL